MSDIVKGEYEDIDPQYTDDMNSLVNVLLSQVLKKIINICSVKDMLDFNCCIISLYFKT